MNLRSFLIDRSLWDPQIEPSSRIIFLRNEINEYTKMNLKLEKVFFSYFYNTFSSNLLIH